MKLKFNVSDDNGFYKEVEYNSKARSTNSPLIEKELEAWVEDTEKYFNIESKKYGWEILTEENKINWNK